MDEAQVIRGDCLRVMPGLPDSSVDLLIADPPYFKVKDRASCAWDHQWKTPGEYLEWVGRLCREWQRLLKPNGSLYVFASPQMAARVECEVSKAFNVLNHITWKKEAGWARKQCKEEMRSYWPASETIIFAEHYGSDNAAKGEAGYAAKCDELRGFVFEPLRAYLVQEFKSLGWNGDDLNRICGTASMAGRHYTSRSQWCLPTAEHYAKLQAAANGRLRRDYEDLRRDYEDLRRDYEDLRRDYEDLRRPFSVSADVPYTDVWDFPTVQHYPGKHPCEKPQSLLLHVIRASSRPGALVLDPFTGGGSTGVAALANGRRFIGIEKDARWARSARQRIASCLPTLAATGS